MDISQFKVQVTRENSSVWVDQETLNNISYLVGDSGICNAFIEVDPFLDWSVLPSKWDKRISSKYNGCVALIQECLFSFIGYGLLFNDFEVDVLNHMVNSHS